MYLYDYQVYLTDIDNFKEGLAPIIEDVIIYDYIEDLKPKIVYETKTRLEMNKEKQRGE
jgi:hypothetical protein